MTPEPMPQAFADAVRNDRTRILTELHQTHPADTILKGEAREHRERWDATFCNRYRGFEGKNGVACDLCRARAERIWADYQRILAKLT